MVDNQISPPKLTDGVYLNKLQNRLHNTFYHLYLYFYKETQNTELPNLKRSLGRNEIDIFNQEARASLIFSFIKLRTFFDFEENDISLINLYKRQSISQKSFNSALNNLFAQLSDGYDKGTLKNNIKLKKQIVINLMGNDFSTELKNLKLIVDKQVAHIDLIDNTGIFYDDLKKIALRIEEIVCGELPRLLIGKPDNYFDHCKRKAEIKKYLSRLYLNNQSQ